MLFIKNIKLKARKLILKFISLFKILEYIREIAYKLDLLNLYEKLYSIFHVSLLKKYTLRKKQVPDLYPLKDLLKLVDNNKE
jgi:hypothetical protein